MTKARLKLSSPWVTYVNYLMALFGNDPDITIEYDEEYEVKLYVDNGLKAGALDMLLPTEKEFGNVTLFITVIPSNDYQDAADLTRKELFDVAFDRNPIYAFSKEIKGIFCNSIIYIVFKNRVVQFFNDNLNDIYGNISTLYQEIASEVFDGMGLNNVCYCTDIEEKVGKPLGEWP